VPEHGLAVQACYSMHDAETFERETRALLKVQDRLDCKRNIIVTFEDEETFTRDGVTIEVIPAWKFLLGK
jgi:hypothetical protein